MKHKQKITDSVFKYYESLCEGLTDEEKKELDIYFEEAILEMTPLLESIENILGNKKNRKKFTKAFKQEIMDKKWHEKL